MSLFSWARRVSMRLTGRTASGTNPRDPNEYGTLAIDPTTRSLYSLLRAKQGGGEGSLVVENDGGLRMYPFGAGGMKLAQDGGGQLIIEPRGSANNPFLQDGLNAIVYSKPGAVAPASMLASIHLSNGADTLIFSAPGTQVWCVEGLRLTNNNAVACTTTCSRSTAGNASRLFVGVIAPKATVLVDGPFYVRPGKPLRGTAALPGVTACPEGYRVR